MENTNGGGFVFLLIFALIGVAIWFFLNRASVRANRQVELLESIDKSLKFLKEAKNGEIYEQEKREKNSLKKTHEEYLAEARKNAGA